MRTWKNVATLVRTKNLDGRFVVRPAADFPFMLEEGCEVAFVPPQTDFPRRGRVQHVRDIDGGTYEVGFDSVKDESTAFGLVGCRCLIRRADIDEVVYEDRPATWVGWHVEELDGNRIGEVAALIDNPGQALLEIVRHDGAKTYVPVVDEFIRDVDVETRVIVVDLPVGLLDL